MSLFLHLLFVCTHPTVFRFLHFHPVFFKFPQDSTEIIHEFNEGFLMCGFYKYNTPFMGLNDFVNRSSLLFQFFCQLSYSTFSNHDVSSFMNICCFLFLGLFM